MYCSSKAHVSPLSVFILHLQLSKSSAVNYNLLKVGFDLLVIIHQAVKTILKLSFGDSLRRPLDVLFP